MKRLEAGILEATARLEQMEQAWCRIAKQEGWKILGRGKCYPTGPELVRVAVPPEHQYRGLLTERDFLASLFDNA